MARKSTAFQNNPAYAASDNVFTGNPSTGLWNRSTVVEYFARLGIAINVGGGTGFTGNVNAPQFIRNGGAAGEFLKADGSVDNTAYAVAADLANYLPLTGGVLTGGLTAQTLTLSGLFSGANMNLSANATAAQFIRSGGASSQFLKADGSIDTNAYLTAAVAASTYLPLAGGTLVGGLIGTTATFSGVLNGANAIFTAGVQATGFSLPAGTAAQFLKGDGSVDTNTYLTTTAGAATYLPLAGGILTGGLTGTTLNLTGTLTGVSIALTGNIAAGQLVRNGGVATEFLKADGSVDNNTYLTTGAAALAYLPLNGGTLVGGLSGTTASFSGNVSAFTLNLTSTLTGVIADFSGVVSCPDLNVTDLLLGVTGTFSGVVTGSQIVRVGGAADEFLKADGTIDDSTYQTQAATDVRYLQLSGGILTGPLSGTTATLTGAITGGSIVRQGGTAAQFLKADGTIDANAYQTQATTDIRYLQLTGGVLTGSLTGTTAIFSDIIRTSLEKGFQSQGSGNNWLWGAEGSGWQLTENGVGDALTFAAGTLAGTFTGNVFVNQNGAPPALNGSTAVNINRGDGSVYLSITGGAGAFNTGIFFGDSTTEIKGRINYDLNLNRLALYADAIERFAVSSAGLSTGYGYTSNLAATGDHFSFQRASELIGTINIDSSTVHLRTVAGKSIVMGQSGVSSNFQVHTAAGNTLSIAGATGQTTVAANIAASYGFIVNNNIATGKGFQIRCTGNSTVGDDAIRLDTGIGNNRFMVRMNGNCENVNNSYEGVSDIKLKENIVDAKSQWADIKALNLKNYNLIETGDRHLGVIAQDLEKIGMKALVSQSIDRDEDEKDLGTTTKSVKYSILYLKAIGALQEAMQRIEILEAK